MDALGAALNVGARSVYKKAADSVNGATFNQRAYKSAHLYMYDSNDVDDTDTSGDDEDWTEVNTRPRALKADGNYEDAEDMFKKPDREAGKLEVIAYKLSEKAAEALSQDYDVSFAYVTCAFKHYRLELARDFNRAAKSESLAADALESAKRRFPVLEDLQKALESSVKVAKSTCNASITHTRPVAQQVNAPAPGVKHPRQVKGSSNLDRIPVISDCEECTDEDISDASTEAFPKEDLKTRAEIEIVPSNPIAANGLDDADVKPLRSVLQKHVTFFDIDLTSDQEVEDKPGWSSDEWEDMVEEEAFSVDSFLTPR